jgi:hypothetical protein
LRSAKLIGPSSTCLGLRMLIFTSSSISLTEVSSSSMSSSRSYSTYYEAASASSFKVSGESFSSSLFFEGESKNYPISLTYFAYCSSTYLFLATCLFYFSSLAAGIGVFCYCFILLTLGGVLSLLSSNTLRGVFDSSTPEFCLL